MSLIIRDELKAKLDRGDDFKLVMVLEEWQFRTAHIPGSVHIPASQIASDGLDLNEEIVVYCSHEACPVSMVAYSRLKSSGYRQVRRYAGGIYDWKQAGYPLESETATKQTERPTRTPSQNLNQAIGRHSHE